MEYFTRYNLILNLISFSIYLVYIEINPKIRRIWLRKNSNNNFFISLSSLWNYSMYPFKEIKLWYPSMWDLNIYISIPIITGLLSVVNEYVKF
uniref:Uncharacterized protein n=1 Tax=viral metagenome TaxID=1070528 RepID=A0A6C0EK99_9ZZZZ